MGIALNDETRRLLDGRHYGVLATLNPDGGPQTSAMWVGRDGDDVVMSTGLSWTYDGRDPDPDPPEAVRVILRMVVDKTTGYAA